MAREVDLFRFVKSEAKWEAAFFGGGSPICTYLNRATIGKPKMAYLFKLGTPKNGAEIKGPIGKDDLRKNPTVYCVWARSSIVVS